jgi:hypothetical protein
MITHLLVHKQNRTPLQYEEKIEDYQRQHNLKTLGWIHVSLCVLGYGIYSFIKDNVMA